MGFPRSEAAEVVEAVLEVLKETLCQGEKVQIVGLGSFQTRKKHERMGRNPKTGEEITIPSRRVLTFKASRILKELVNNRQHDHGQS